MIYNIGILITILAITFYLKTKNNSYIKKKISLNSNPLFSKLVYTDQQVKDKKENITYSKILTSEKYNIQGKPDFVFKRFNTYIPVEFKSGKIGNRNDPFNGDLLQLIAYFLIVSEVYEGKVKYGLLIYSDYTFVVKNNKHFRNMLISQLNSMRKMIKTGNGNAECSFIHCKHCICKMTVCEFYKQKVKSK